MPDYATVEELRQLMAFPPGQEQDDVDLQRALDSGRRWIDWFTGRTFGTTSTPSARTFAASAADVLDVGDLTAAAPTVEVDTAGDRTFATTLLPAQYQLEPLDGPPFHLLRLWPTPPSGTDPAAAFGDGQLVRVTGTWGYADARGRIPANVNQANLLLGARWFSRRLAPFSVLQSVELGTFQRVPSMDDDVNLLLFSVCVPGSPGAALLASQLAAAGGTAGGEWVAV